MSKWKIRGNISGENGFKDNISCDNVILCDDDYDFNNYCGNYCIVRCNGFGC